MTKYEKLQSSFNAQNNHSARDQRAIELNPDQICATLECQLQRESSSDRQVHGEAILRSMRRRLAGWDGDNAVQRYFSKS